MTNPPWTGLTINTKAPGFSWVSPRAEINGHAMPLNWGVNHIPAQPGVHNIHIYMPWIWRYGKADITVDNRYAPAPPVYYATPYVNFVKGAIGLEPVKNPGLLGMLLVILVPAVLLVLCCLGASIFGD